MSFGPLLSNSKDQEHDTWHTLQDYVISMQDPHLTLTYIMWSSDFALYLWLYLIDKHHTLDTFSVSH